MLSKRVGQVVLIVIRIFFAVTDGNVMKRRKQMYYQLFNLDTVWFVLLPPLLPSCISSNKRF